MIKAANSLVASALFLIYEKVAASMNTGEIVRDGQGQSYEIGPMIGRGLWGKTYSVRTQDGMEWCLKVPLSPKDLPSGQERLAQSSRKIVAEMGQMLSDIKAPQLMRPRKQFTTKEGVPCLLFPKNESTMERRLKLGCSMTELLAICVQLVEALDVLPVALKAHGNLHPRNIFISSRGMIQLSDPITPTLAKEYQALKKARNINNPFVPPEIRNQKLSSPQDVFIDTYSIAMLLLHGVLQSDSAKLPTSGMSKELRESLQELVLNRLKTEDANPRFHKRLSSALSRFLNRALSDKSEPSPPFRFHSLSAFGERLQYLHNLIDPAITHVGQVLLDRPPASRIFQTNEAVKFSCTIDSAPKLENYEEALCGLRIFDRVRDTRVRGNECEYTVDSHPTGRLRFGFIIKGLPPAQYRVQIAFKVRDSSADPMVANGEFEVHPAPGWVPPKNERPRKPIPITPQMQDSTPIPSIVEAQDSHEDTGSIDAPAVKPKTAAHQVRRRPPIVTLVDEHSEMEEPSESIEEPAVKIQLKPPIDSNQHSPAVVDLSSAGHIRVVDDYPEDEPEYTGPAEMTDHWNAFVPTTDGKVEIELESHEDYTENSIDESPTIIASLMSMASNLFSDFFGLFIFGGLMVIAILILLLINFTG